MEGMVLGHDAEGGVIRTADGTRYRFVRSEWKSPVEPQPGDRVDFIAEEDRAREIYLLSHRAPGINEIVEGIEKSEKTFPTIVYLCYCAAFLWGVTMIAGVVIAYLYRGSAAGTWYGSHYDYQIGIFWKSLLGFLLGILLSWVFALGIIIMFGTYAWVVVKIVRGWRCLAEGQPAPLTPR